MGKKPVFNFLITISVVVVAIVLVGWVLANNKKKNAEKTAIVAQVDGTVVVRVVNVKKQPLQHDFTANGNFIPSQQLNFSAENSGRILSVLVDEGSRVSKGQTLAIIKADQLNVDVESAALAYQVALRDKERYENAFTTGGVTQQQLDQARLALSNAKARMTQAKLRLRDTHIRSSISGIVNKRFIEPGAVVAPGTQLFELVDVSKLILQTAVNENQVAQLKEGDKVNIRVSVFPEKTFTGELSFIAPKADNALNFPIEIEMASNPGEVVKAGMYGTAVFSFPALSPVILLPRSSFIGSVSSNEIFIIKEDNTASIRKVVAGRTMGDQVEIIEGLHEGERVIVSGQINLEEGTKVSVVK